MNAYKNKVILSVAGAGKTTSLVKDALNIASNSTKKILIITYTNNGINAIVEKVKECNNGILHPKIQIISWYSFLLHECVIPYQKDFSPKLNITQILFQDKIPKNKKGLAIYTFKNKADLKRYISSTGKIYADTISDFLIQINKKNHGLYLKRLFEVYSDIYIDEIQDLNGEDLDIIEQLLNSGINIHLIGDHRQSTFNTHSSTKYKKFKGQNIKLIFQEWEKAGKILIEEKLESYRCIKDICEFSNLLYPYESPAISLNSNKTNFDGVFLIERKNVISFYNMFSPFVLRWNKKQDVLNLPATNFGDCKALTKERVLLFPTQPLLHFYLFNKPLTTDVSKYYVALTRARQSICIVVDKFPNKNFLTDFQLDDLYLKKFDVQKMKTN